ncbi:MAG: hypothetical protein WCO35_01605 [Candidatus Nomurabacteria bacterium]
MKKILKNFTELNRRVLFILSKVREAKIAYVCANILLLISAIKSFTDNNKVMGLVCLITIMLQYVTLLFFFGKILYPIFYKRYMGSISPQKAE